MDSTSDVVKRSRSDVTSKALPLFWGRSNPSKAYNIWIGSRFKRCCQRVQHVMRWTARSGTLKQNFRANAPGNWRTSRSLPKLNVVYDKSGYADCDGCGGES